MGTGTQSALGGPPRKVLIGLPGGAIALRWMLLGLTLFAVYLCWPMWPALVLAAWTAALARPLFLRFERRLKGRRRAAAVLSFLLFLVLLVPVGLISIGVIAGAQDMWQALSQSSSVKSALESVAAGAAGGPTVELPTSFGAALQLAQQFGAQGVSMLTGFAGVAATGVLGVVVYLGGSFVFLLDGPALWAWLKQRAPFAPAHLDRLGGAFHETGRGLLIGVGLTAATQGLLATLAYVALGVPRWWVLGPITGLAAMVPFVGTTLVWAPLALGLFFTGHPIKAAILLAVGLGVIGTVDNFLRPMFARMAALQLPMFLVFIAALGGLAAFGPFGALLGPLVVRLWVEAVELQRGVEVAPAVAVAAPPEARPTPRPG